MIIDYLLCKEQPKLQLRPPSVNGNYLIELGRVFQLECLVDPTVYPTARITALKIQDNETMTISMVLL